MSVFIFSAIFLVAVGIVIAVVSARKREKFFAAPFPSEWEKILRRNVPLYAKIPETLRPKLHREIKEFLADVIFEACGGLKEVSDEMALTIAGNAAILSVNRTKFSLGSVLVYPGEFSAHGDSAPSDGESWTHGSVIFSWKRITRDIALHGNGQNVIIHEFAHQLDAADGIDGGMPYFRVPADRKAWQRVAANELERLRSGDPTTVIDEYGAENPAEFFATAVEAFFEKSVAMKTAHPELYALLEKLFGHDPASWELRN